MKLKSNYQKTFQYVRKNARNLTYDVGYRLYQRDDGSYVYGWEIVQEAHDGRLGSGATALNFEGTFQDAETHLRNILSEKIECLPEEWESDRFKNRKETDESALTNGWLVRRIFGYWPEFHDAEILSVALYRRPAGTGARTDLELSIHHWGQDDPDWKEQGPHCRLTFLLEGVEGQEFATENVAHPSYISDLRFSHCEDGRIQMDLDPSSGFSILLYCKVARLVSVEPYPMF
jgi:hypothetical protein